MSRDSRFVASGLVENADDQTPADPSLLRILARAHDIQARLIQNPKLTVHDIAREEHVSAAYLYSLLRLPWLAPDITTAIINGRKPPQLAGLNSESSSAFAANKSSILRVPASNPFGFA